MSCLARFCTQSQDVFTVIWVLRAMKVLRLKGGLGCVGKGGGIKAPRRYYYYILLVVVRNIKRSEIVELYFFSLSLHAKG